MAMAPVKKNYSSKEANRGAWTAEEDQKLAQVIETNGPRRWRSIAVKAGLNRCGKSCRLRWMNYLRPNIKRGNISDQEEDLILRLHKLLGNRWSLIARRLPGRTDNEIKNYWNSHLSKKMNLKEKQVTRRSSKGEESVLQKTEAILDMNINIAAKESEEGISMEPEKINNSSFVVEELSDSFEGPLDLVWMSQFLELDESIWYNQS